MGTIKKLKSSSSELTRGRRINKASVKPQVTLRLPDSTIKAYLVSVDMLQKIQMELELNSEGPDVSDIVEWRTALALDNENSNEGGIVLQGLRQRENLTQAQLAKKLALEQSNICLMEQGKRPIGKAMAKRLATIFETDYRVFL